MAMLNYQRVSFGIWMRFGSGYVHDSLMEPEWTTSLQSSSKRIQVLCRPEQVFLFFSLSLSLSPSIAIKHAQTWNLLRLYARICSACSISANGLQGVLLARKSQLLKTRVSPLRRKCWYHQHSATPHHTPLSAPRHIVGWSLVGLEVMEAM